VKTACRSQWIIFLVVTLFLIFTTIDVFGAQDEQPAPPSRKNALELEVAAVSLGLSYARWTWRSWFLGVGAGLGPTIMIDTQDTIWGAELCHLRVFISRRAFSWLTVDAGPYLGLNYNDSDYLTTPMCGAEVTALAGWRHVKIGPSIQVGWLLEREEVYAALKPVVLRLTLDW
jgi:hypothetical protein